jgi:Uma2 family endonuclease
MSSAITDPAMPPPTPAPPTRIRNYHVIGGDVRIPGWVVDFDSFRQWTLSDEFPETGRIDFIDHEIWADMTMEELFLHNQIKARIALVLGPLIEGVDSGMLIHDRMRLINTAANLSNEPDMAFAFWETLKSGRLQTRGGAPGRDVELVGTPDMVLEVVSDRSVQKDTVRLFSQYAAANVSEYWIADGRLPAVRFEIYQLIESDYVLAGTIDGWMKSNVFHHDFRLVRTTNPLGKPQFNLEFRSWASG